MSHSKLYFMSKFVFSVLLGGFISVTAFAGSSNSTSVKSGWNSGGNANSNSASSDTYLLAGCFDTTWKESCHGTFDDEGAIVLNVARKFNDNGGYFCPTQIQFGNKNRKRFIWVNLYSVVNGADCRWICKQGWSGENCAENDTGAVCGTGSLKNLKRGSVRTSGGESNKISSTVDIFSKSEHATENKNRNADIEVLAIIAYYEHGVLVGRVKVSGQRDWTGENVSGEIVSWVTGVTLPTEKYLLCDTGYKPNANNTDCEPVDRQACGLAPDPVCSGWTEQEYKANETDLEYRKIGNCYQYRCMDRNKAFPSATSRICEPCSTGVRGGSDRDTGVCKKCDLGQFFDENTGNCKSATGLSKHDLQYGKGKSNTGKPKDQCWTKTDPDAYRCCVMNDSQSCGRARATADMYEPMYQSVATQ